MRPADGNSGEADAAGGAWNRKQRALCSVVLSNGFKLIVIFVFSASFKFHLPKARLGPLVEITSATDDATFFRLLESDQKFDVVMFAPGACRWSQSGQPIPGQSADTMNWRVGDYHSVVREKQGNGRLRIVETCEEREIIPRLMGAFAEIEQEKKDEL